MPETITRRETKKDPPIEASPPNDRNATIDLGNI